MTRMEHKMKVSRSVTSFLLTKAGDLIAIWLVLLVSSILLWPQIAQLQKPVLLLILVIGAAVFVFFLTVLLRQRFIAFLKTFFDRIGLSRFNFVEQALNHLQNLANMNQVTTLRILGVLILCSFVYLAVSLAWVYANYAVFHLHVEPVIFIFVSVLMQLVSYIPIVVFGGLGITESSSLYFFGVFGINPTILAPVLVGCRILFYLLNLLPLIYLPLYAIFQGKKLQSD